MSDSDSSCDSCGTSSHIVTPQSSYACNNPKPFPPYNDLVTWERLISANPEAEQDTAIRFFIAKQDMKLTYIRAEVEDGEMTIHLRIGGTYYTDLELTENTGDVYYNSKKLNDLSVSEGQRVDIYIPADTVGSGEDLSNLTVELEAKITREDAYGNCG